MNVLIVEDEKSLSHELEIYLTKQNFHCDVAFSGKAGDGIIVVSTVDDVLNIASKKRGSEAL